jgi:hypothetical protein
VPLVQVLSRRECRRLFKAFGDVRIRADHVEPWHFVPFAKAVHGELRRRFERLARHWGWYLTVFARK